MEKLPKASIVIAAYNNAKTLERVLDAMLELIYPNDFEVIVANDGSTDGTEKMLAKEFGKQEKIKIINLQHGGVCKARNAGIKAAKFPIVVNMDHDCIPAKNWLKEMVHGFSHEKTGVVSAYDYFGGTSTAFRKELLEKVGGYDEAYRYYREDTDLSFKIMDLGYEFKLVKADYVHDHEMVKPKGFGGMLAHLLQRLSYHQNDVLLYKKHPTKICEEFLHIKFGFLANPLDDFKAATGLWQKGAKLSLSSPRGIKVIENKTPLHTAAIFLAGIAYVFAVKASRLYGSIRFGKLLL
ncbi:MAG: glycosyltransferase family A protein [Candidatus Diapherotrites archaeon]